MNEPKPFASLGPSLLARKGAARPAMRPQVQPLQQFHEATARQLEEDLGWNDMGDDIAPVAAETFVPEAIAPEASLTAPARIVPIASHVAEDSAAMDVPVAAPEVHRQQESVAARLSAAPEKVVAVEKRVAPAPRAASPQRSAPARRSALGDGRRAAFTLRLDSERHLKLRLACTITGRSAQQLVTDALDQLVSDLPEVGSLAEQVRKHH